LIKAAPYTSGVHALLWKHGIQLVCLCLCICITSGFIHQHCFNDGISTSTASGHELHQMLLQRPAGWLLLCALACPAQSEGIATNLEHNLITTRHQLRPE
jgi:hypothetical protein